VDQKITCISTLSFATSTNAKWNWGEPQKKALAMAKRIIAREVLLAYPDFSKPFQIHTDASHYQLGAVISQDCKPIALYSRKLKPEQTRYTTTERELLSIVETLKEYRNLLLGHKIEVFMDHKNLTYKEFNTERVMCWRLLLEEFGPKLTYIKGVNNVVADFLSRMNIHPQEMSADAFANQVDFPTEYPLSFGQIQHKQAGDKEIQKLLKSKPEFTKRKSSSTLTRPIPWSQRKTILSSRKSFRRKQQSGIISICYTQARLAWSSP
jgi:RNase H-like domain found in reverse transcriptase